MLYYTAMNTLVASWSGRLRAHIGRLGRWVSAWSIIKKKQREEDMELKPEVKERLWAQIEEAKQGKNTSPVFTSTEDAIAYLHEEARKYREEKE